MQYTWEGNKALSGPDHHLAPSGWGWLLVYYYLRQLQHCVRDMFSLPVHCCLFHCVQQPAGKGEMGGIYH